jgi:nucleotide-binding universal stress UspA family protein
MKILLAVDESKSSEEAVRKLIVQTRPDAAQVRVLSVVEPVNAYFSADLMPHMVTQIAEVEKDRNKQAKALVKRVAEKLAQAGFKTSQTTADGDTTASILDEAKSWKADLIVLGSHGWKGLNRLLLGSVSDAVARHAECSVEIIRIPQPRKTSGK